MLTREEDIVSEHRTLVNIEDDSELPLYYARPVERSPRGAVVIYHSSAGWTPAVKEICRRFATFGYLSLVPNLHDVDAPGSSSEVAAERSKAAGGVADSHVLAVFESCLAFLAANGSWNRRIATVGYCAGGRQSFLTACRHPLSAAVVCYGGNIVPTGRPTAERLARQPVAPIELASSIDCELLGLFGAEDKNPSPEHVAQISAELTRLNKRFEVQVYPGTGHAFFDVTRDEYRPRSVNDGWRRIGELFACTLS